MYPAVPASLGAMHGKFMMRLEIPPKNKEHLLVVTFGTAPSESPETSAQMFDLYDIFTLPSNIIVGQVERYITEAHENIEEAFEKSLTNKTRELFEEKGA